MKRSFLRSIIMYQNRSNQRIRPKIDLINDAGIKLTPKHYAYVKISEGCNHRCTFCIIPSLRGDLVSRPIDSVMKEAVALKNQASKNFWSSLKIPQLMAWI